MQDDRTKAQSILPDNPGVRRFRVDEIGLSARADAFMPRRIPAGTNMDAAFNPAGRSRTATLDPPGCALSGSMLLIGVRKLISPSISTTGLDHA